VTIDGSRGFQPTEGHPSKNGRRVATFDVEATTPVINLRYATEKLMVRMNRGLKPTATINRHYVTLFSFIKQQ
jgi:hypothetical protein